MDFRRILHSSKVLTFTIFMVLNLNGGAVSAEISNSKIQSLEKSFHSISNKFQLSLSKNLIQCKSHARSLKSLNSQLQKLSDDKKGVIGVCLIQNNFTFIESNIDSKEVIDIVDFLLNRNSLFLANKIYKVAKNEGESSLVSNISFIYAKYYIKRKEWEKALIHIKGTYNALTSEDANLARLYTGIALQKLKKHRPAVKIYSQITKGSKYYPTARLNIATAYIRQDWWTDAHNEINNLINNKNLRKNNETINRLYLVLGYSLLHKEFYRDSREAFRNIELDSAYFNKALLGIALTATNQEDYIGALNAINILKEKQNYDLSVDESHLLLPYIYEKLSRNLTASAGYTDAQMYYQERIKKINLIKMHNNIDAKEILKNNHKINIENNIIDASKHYPASFLENSTHLDELSIYKTHIKDKILLKRFSSLRNKHASLLAKITNDVFNTRLTHLESYMNQSRFGLARLFDNSNTAQK